VEKQSLVHNGKLKVQEDYTQKNKDLDVEQRVYVLLHFGYLFLFSPSQFLVPALLRLVHLV
jgi:hypothetical protein